MIAVVVWTLLSLPVYTLPFEPPPRYAHPPITTPPAHRAPHHP